MDDATVNAQVMRVLTAAGGAVPLSAIVRAMPTGSRSAVRNALRALADAGAIDRPRHGYYSLPSFRQQPDGDKTTSYQHAGPDFVFIPLAGLQQAAGNEEGLFTTELGAYCAMDRTALRQMTAVDPAQLLMLVATGTSMGGSIQPGDRIMISVYGGQPVIHKGIYVWHSDWNGVCVARAHYSGTSIIVQGDGDEQPIVVIDKADPDPLWRPVARVHQVIKPL